MSCDCDSASQWLTVCVQCLLIMLGVCHCGVSHGMMDMVSAAASSVLRAEGASRVRELLPVLVAFLELKIEKFRFAGLCPAPCQGLAPWTPLFFSFHTSSCFCCTYWERD